MTLQLPRPEGAPAFVLGHRGARARAAENSILAFDLALQEGADGVEIDVRLSSDGELVVVHDELIRPDGTHARVRVGRLSSAQLQRLRMQGEPIPTLREVLEWGARKNAVLNVELKRNVSAPGWMARRAAQMVAQIGTDNVFFSSFDPLIVWQTARALREVPSALLMYEGQRRSQRVVESSPTVLKMMGARGFHPSRQMVTQEGIERRKSQGLFVVVWTVNDPEEAEQLVDWGVDAIITDNPREIVEHLRQH